MISFSIVINTLNRASLLRKTLQSFRWLKYEGDFEVIVVNGPSTDDTDEVISEWRTEIKSGRCEVANLSRSRNVGICMAQGEVVAFIDDDAIPEPEWLTQLAAAYDSKEIGGAGGAVFDHTGYAFQYKYSTANRLANANWSATSAAEHLCFPASFEFPYLQGTNASFRREALLEVGGFDEEIEFYLDETELCCRLIDAGYVIRQLDNAYVHHKFAPSNIRDTQRITRNRYPVLKNKIYFSLKHGRPYYSLSDIFEDNRKFCLSHRADVETHIAARRLEKSDLERFDEDQARAWEIGVPSGLREFRELITEKKISRWSSPFRKFEPITNLETKTIVLVSKDFPPFHGGGIATFTKDLAEALAALGNIVHVITQSSDIDRVDLEHGVWVHRVRSREHPQMCEGLVLKIPQHIWNWSASALCEAARIATHRSIDVIEAPVWDCEGVAFVLDGRWPVVTSLQTTLHFWLDSRPGFRNDASWMKDFGTPMLNIERWVMQRSDAIRSISQSIRTEIETAYEFQFDPNAVVLVPLGLHPVASSINKERIISPKVSVLFVGRLEFRKGIDILLAAIPIVLSRFPDVEFHLLGDDTLEIGPGLPTYRDEFFKSETGTLHGRKVHFEGRVTNERLTEAYSSCDIFVAPSRFESFGLVFLEAMRHARPVIGCRAGGVPEIVNDQVNGILVEPNNASELANAIIRLIEDKALREKLGREGLETFQKKFTARQMALNSSEILSTAVKTHQNRRP